MNKPGAIKLSQINIQKSVYDKEKLKKSFLCFE